MSKCRLMSMLQSSIVYKVFAESARIDYAKGDVGKVGLVYLGLYFGFRMSRNPGCAGRTEE